ncbi:MAG: dTMP kinase [Oligoflexia bacterium]|nr:dTMP kinase [Oligoflexia bacterium]
MKFFVTLEGIEGAGKTTQIRLLEKALVNSDIDFILTREPGGIKSAEAIRELLLHEDINPKTELLLYEAARSEHIEHVIQPALDSDILVICDRYTDATIAYQGFGRGIDLDLINRLNDIATGGTYPDITFVLDMPPEKISERLERRGLAPDRLEKLGSEFYKKVREGYLYLREKEPERVHIIDATDSRENIHEKIFSIIEKRLGL